MAALNPTWSAGQREIAQQYPHIAQEMNAKAVLYEHLSGVSIRDNPAMLAWAYNTSMDNVRASAEAQRRRVVAGQPLNFNLAANRQLGSTVYKRLMRSLGLTHEPDGRGMGSSSQSDAVRPCSIGSCPTCGRARRPFRTRSTASSSSLGPSGPTLLRPAVDWQSTDA
jgi:hypothetical protein